MDWLGLSTEEWTAVRLSLRVATVATIVALPFGVAIALILARGRFWGQSLLNGLVHLPLILPGIIAGLILCFAKAIGEFGATITFVSNIPGETQTAALAIYDAIQAHHEQAAIGMIAVLSAVAIVTLYGVNKLTEARE